MEEAFVLGQLCGMATGTSRIDLSTLRAWTFITHHAQVLLAVAGNPKASVAEIADAAEITERSAYRVLADLQKAGYVRRKKAGRENRYEINREQPLRDPLVQDGVVADLLMLATATSDDSPSVHIRTD